jgi:VWFA-related protein
MKSRELLCLVAAGGMAFVSLTAAGKPSEVVRESAEVTLVEVPVNVTGKDGKPIAGLTADDFEIQDDGRPQAIESIDVVDLRQKAVGSGLPGDLPAVARRHFFFLFDLSFASSNEIDRSRAAALRFLEEGLAAGDLASVGTTSVERGARVLVTFTSDRRQLAAAIRSIGLPNELEQVRDPLGFAFRTPGDPFLVHNVTGEQTPGKESRGNPLDPGATQVYAMMAQRTADEFSLHRVGQHLSEMSTLATALDMVSGRKIIIYFSEGFDGRLLSGSAGASGSTAETNAENDSISSGSIWAVDIERRYPNSALQRELSETLGLFRRSDCIVYPIDIAGLKADGSATFGGGRGESSLYAIASETGGELIKNANDLSAQMMRIAEKTSLTYVLTFRPSHSGKSDRFHALKVKVKARGARVSARSGYYEQASFQTLRPLQRALAAAEVITHEKQKSDFPLEVLAVAFPQDQISQVPVLLEIPPGALPSPAPKDRFHLGIYVYVTDEAGQLVDYFTRSLAIDMARDGARFSQSGLTFYGTCHVLPGRYHVRAYVRDEQNGRFGFRVLVLDVPAAGASPIQALPPLFVSSDVSALRVKDRGDADRPAGDPFRIGSEMFVPEIRPALMAGGHARVCLMVYRKSDATPASPFRIDAEIRDASGRRLGPAALSLLGRSSLAEDSPVKLLLDLAVSDLPAGEYSLAVTFSDSADQNIAARSETRFRIS